MSYITNKNITSISNSTITTLGVGGVFTGVSEDILQYNSIIVTVTGSHTSATDGLSIQQSIDGTNWDIIDTYTIPASTGKTYTVGRQGRYVRIVYTNGGVAQSSFRLNTYYSTLVVRPTSHRPIDGYTNETDADQVQAFPMMLNTSGTWDRVRGTPIPSGGTGIQALAVNNLAQQKATYIIPINRLQLTALAANTTRQILSIEHASTSTKTLRIRRIHLGVLNTTAVAGDLRVFVDYGTAASTAGTVLAGQPTLSSSPAHDFVAKTVPTIAAATTKFVAFVGSAVATANTPIVGTTVYEPAGDDIQQLMLRPGVLENLTIGIQSFGANIYHLTGYVVLTEE